MCQENTTLEAPPIVLCEPDAVGAGRILALAAGASTVVCILGVASGAVHFFAGSAPAVMPERPAGGASEVVKSLIGILREGVAPAGLLDEELQSQVLQRLFRVQLSRVGPRAAAARALPVQLGGAALLRSVPCALNRLVLGYERCYCEGFALINPAFGEDRMQLYAHVMVTLLNQLHPELATPIPLQEQACAVLASFMFRHDALPGGDRGARLKWAKRLTAVLTTRLRTFAEMCQALAPRSASREATKPNWRMVSLVLCVLWASPTLGQAERLALRCVASSSSAAASCGERRGWTRAQQEQAREAVRALKDAFAQRSVATLASRFFEKVPPGAEPIQEPIQEPGEGGEEALPDRAANEDSRGMTDQERYILELMPF